MNTFSRFGSSREIGIDGHYYHVRLRFETGGLSDLIIFTLYSSPNPIRYRYGPRDLIVIAQVR